MVSGLLGMEINPDEPLMEAGLDSIGACFLYLLNKHFICSVYIRAVLCTIQPVCQAEPHASLAECPEAYLGVRSEYGLHITPVLKCMRSEIKKTDKRSLEAGKLGELQAQWSCVTPSHRASPSTSPPPSHLTTRPSPPWRSLWHPGRSRLRSQWQQPSCNRHGPFLDKSRP